MSFHFFASFLGKSKNFAHISENYTEKNYWMQLCRTTDTFRKKAQLSKNFKLFEKTLFLLINIKNVLTIVWKVVRITADSGIWYRHFRLPNRGYTRYM